MRRRRTFRRRFAGKSGGRSYYWFRFTPFGVTLVQAATATHSDILLAETDWADPSDQLNQTRRGGPRLERLIVDYGLSIEAAPAFYANSGDANIALIPEFMIWKQNDQFASVVSDSAGFDATRSSHRIIMDEVPHGDREFNFIGGATAPLIRSVQGRYETKSKVRLSEGALGIAWRGLFDTAAGNLLGYTDWVRPTLLISVP